MSNFDKWIDNLRTTTLPQASAALMAGPSDNPGYCCLGLGCKQMGLEVVVKHTQFNDMVTGEFVGNDPVTGLQKRFGTLAPREFIEWLGVPGRLVSSGYDIELDYPTSDAFLPRDGDFDDMSAAGLNDSGYTFAQIADLFDYFGVRHD